MIFQSISSECCSIFKVRPAVHRVGDSLFILSHSQLLVKLFFAEFSKKSRSFMPNLFFRFCSMCVILLIPSLDKSTYGFCRQKCSLTLCVALTGASLPAAPHFLRRHFCRAKTPQDFSARGNQMMTRKRTAGILAYFKVR